MILFVTMFRDIGRDKWTYFQRPVSEYINRFKFLAEQIEYPMIAYVEGDVIESTDKLQVVDLNSVQTFIHTHIESERAIMNTKEYQSKIPECRKICPEHIYPEYTLLNHSKIQYIADAKKRMPNYDYYVWIDFGFAVDSECVPRNIDTTKLGSRILFNTLDPIPDVHISPREMLSSSAIYMLGTTFIVPSPLVEVFEALYTKKLNEWQSAGIADDDQNMYYQIWVENKEYFRLIPTNRWRSLFNDLAAVDC
jgi:Bacterial protein of unknown function (HtrL_YibB)